MIFPTLKVKRIIGGGFTPLALFGADAHLILSNNPSTIELNGANVRWWNDQSNYGNNVGNSVVSQQPLWNTTKKAVEFDSIGEDLDLPIAIWGTDQSGTWYLRVEDLDGTGVANVMIDSALSNTDRALIQFQTNDTFRHVWKGYLVNHVATYPTGIARSTDQSIIVKGQNTFYSASVDGSDLGTPTPDNDGFFYGDCRVLSSRSKLSGNATGAVYYGNAFKAAVYVNRVTSTDEDVLMLDWMNTL